MKAFELGETVHHKTADCTGTIVYIDKYDAVPYLVRFDADSPYGWRMCENIDNVMHLPQYLIDDYIDDEDYKFWWLPATLLEHVDDAQKLKGEEKKIKELHTNDRVYHQKQTDGIVDKVDIAVGTDKDIKYHDTHYKSCAIEPIDAMQHILTAEQFKGFLMGNAIKYRLRAGYKDDVKADIDKALRYEQWLKEFEQEGEIIL